MTEVSEFPVAPIRRQYQNPPVQEALIAFQIESPSPPSIGVLNALHEGEEIRYPVREVMMTGSLQVDPATGTVTHSTQELDGCRITNDQGTMTAQFRRSQFAFARLAPYVAWEEWEDEARRLWYRYREAIGVAAVTAVTVRYVNRIDIRPAPGQRIRDYLNFFPNVPEQFPQAITGFVMRTEMKVPDLADTTLAVNAGRVEPPGPGIYSVLLDIDLKTSRHIADESAAWQTLESLHLAENGYFESCVTDLAREEFG